MWILRLGAFELNSWPAGRRFWCSIPLPLVPPTPLLLYSPSNPSRYQLGLKAAAVFVHRCVFLLFFFPPRVCLAVRLITPAQTTSYRLPVNRHFSAHHLLTLQNALHLPTAHKPPLPPWGRKPGRGREHGVWEGAWGICDNWRCSVQLRRIFSKTVGFTLCAHLRRMQYILYTGTNIAV